MRHAMSKLKFVDCARYCHKSNRRNMKSEFIDSNFSFQPKYYGAKKREKKNKGKTEIYFVYALILHSNTHQSTIEPTTSCSTIAPTTLMGHRAMSAEGELTVTLVRQFNSPAFIYFHSIKQPDFFRHIKQSLCREYSNFVLKLKLITFTLAN